MNFLARKISPKTLNHGLPLRAGRKPGAEFLVHGCRARYQLSGISVLQSITDSPSQALFRSTLERFGISFQSPSGELLRDPEEYRGPSVPWKSRCRISAEPSSLVLEGYFFQDSIYYLPVLWGIALGALTGDVGVTTNAQTEAAYGFDLLLDDRTGEMLKQYMVASSQWAGEEDRFSCREVDDQGVGCSLDLHLQATRVKVNCQYTRAQLVAPVDAIPEIEKQLSQMIQALPIAIRVLPLG